MAARSAAQEGFGGNSDFAAFRACEEAVLRQIPVSDDDEQILQLLMSSDCMKSMAIVLQRGSGEARFGVLVSALMVGLAIVFAHGAFRVPEDLFLDEAEPLARVPSLLSFLAGGAPAPQPPIAARA
ncbi:PRA1 family protein B1-like [Salvia miltiorrhiza]|uniref:PRA1 family protein B1-like n=1 Tax=Salvia miltiorrhiza TaxID=226208 RepID=UPI0025AD6FFA|nr:PRA1 family protein B1-like [Salvia miltiorrhiza]